MNRTHRISAAATILGLASVPAGAAPRPSGEEVPIAPPPNGSAIARALSSPDGAGLTADASLFRIAPPEPRTYQRHDLIQIIVREYSAASSSHELTTEKGFVLGGEINAWPHLDLASILQLQLKAGNTPDDELPAVDIRLAKGFEGDGEYDREDELSARLTAEVIEVLPNGNLVLEARTTVANDEEITTIAVTGVCRPTDVTAANTVLSNQIHDLRIAKNNEGELRKTNEKGIVSQVFDFLFAW